MAPPPSELRRVLGAWDAAALIVGIIIGSGIFAAPPLVAAHLPGTVPMLGIWVLGGALAFCGALCYAELAAMFPQTGGSYVFLREGYGRLPAFAYGWCALLVTYPASIAAVAMVFSYYFARVVALPPALSPYFPGFLCLLLTLLNILGVRLGAWVLRIFTASKVLALLAIAAAVFLARSGSVENLAPLMPASGGIGPGAAALALVAVIFTYEGWTDGPTVSGELRDPERNMVRALFLGTLGVLLVYLLVNFAYVYVLGVDGIRDSDSVASDVAGKVFGPRGNGFVTLLVLVSTLGSMMGMIIGGSRVFFAMGRDRLFFTWAGRVAPTGTPAGALAALGVISAAYTLIGSFEAVIGYFVFVSTIFLTLNVGSVILHRRKNPQRPRRFRVPLYPVPPVLYLLVAAGLMFQLFRENTRDALIGLGVVSASAPMFWIWRRWRG